MHTLVHLKVDVSEEHIVNFIPHLSSTGRGGRVGRAWALRVGDRNLGS